MLYLKSRLTGKDSLTLLKKVISPADGINHKNPVFVLNHVFLCGNSSPNERIKKSFTAMKRFNQNPIQASEGGSSESNIRPSLLNKPAPRHYTRAGAAIFVIIILHFVSQFIFLQSEKTAPKTEAINHQSVEIQPEAEIRPENNQIAEIETESAAKKPRSVTKPKTVPPVVQPEPTSAPSRAVIKKKEPRGGESRAERLRRAERLLTGV